MIDHDLYSRMFTGRAKQMVRCRFYLSDGHLSTSFTFNPLDKQNRAASNSQKEICMLYNKPSGNLCHCVPCHYEHWCSKCLRRNHPASACREYLSHDYKTEIHHLHLREIPGRGRKNSDHIVKPSIAYSSVSQLLTLVFTSPIAIHIQFTL